MSFPTSSTPPQRWLPIVLALIALLAVAVPLAIALNPPHIPPHLQKRIAQPSRVVPAAELPPVEPVRFQQLDPSDARAWNASVPSSMVPIRPRGRSR